MARAVLPTFALIACASPSTAVLPDTEVPASSAPEEAEATPSSRELGPVWAPVSQGEMEAEEELVGPQPTPTLTCGPTLAVHDERDLVLTLHTHEGLVTALAQESWRLDTLDLGGEPTRLACGEDVVWVTLRQSGEVVRIALTEEGLVVEERVEVGAEPVGIAASLDLSELYVALSREDAVVVLDSGTLAETGRYAVEGEPRWLALHRTGDPLVVASATRPILTRISPGETGSTALSLPEVSGMEDLAALSGEVVLTARLTGDPAFSQDGQHLAVPALFVNNVFGASGELGEGSTGQEVIVEYYGSPSIVDPDSGSARFNPGIWVPSVEDLEGPGGGSPPGDILDIGGRASFEDGSTPYVRSYLTSVAFGPEGDTLLATMEASDVVVGVLRNASASDEHFGWERRGQVFQAVGRGPRSLVVSGTRLFVDEQLSGTLGRVDWSLLGDRIETRWNTTQTLAYDESDGDPVVLRADPEDAVLALGRDLFFNAISPIMVSDGAGVSCSTCHFEGRNDGLSWPLENGPRQTPSLAGEVSKTVPVTWNEQVPSVAEEVELTSILRMGGEGATGDDAAAVAAWIDAGRLPVPPLARLDPDAIDRGEKLFLSREVGCADCHPPPLYTDNQHYELLEDGEMNVPSLLGIGASAPYLHDGSAETLFDVFLWSDQGGMGDTAHLSMDELDDLEAFLRSL